MITKKTKAKLFQIVIRAVNIQVINCYFNGEGKDCDFRKAIGKNGEAFILEKIKELSKIVSVVKQMKNITNTL